MTDSAFVFVVCGERHVTRLRIAIRFLRQFSRRDIVVVSRRPVKVAGDEMITARVPAGLDDHRASIFLKTSLHRILKGKRRAYCYLDSDVMAVSHRVDEIFDQPREGVLFATDHCGLEEFERYAVNCRCKEQGCGHLREAIRRKFGVEVADKGWRHWNGGVFVFDEQGAEFLEAWHQYTLAAFKDRYWKTRDQGTLVAAVWKFRRQGQATLAPEFNFVVDPFKFNATPFSKRKGVEAGKLKPDESYTLGGNGTGKPSPAFLHFINGGSELKGWRNWDDAERWREKARSVKPAVVNGTAARPVASGLSEDNRVVHGLWIGRTLSKMELLTIHSFIRNGHEFHLWLYDGLDTPLPKEVVIEDANEIIPKSRIMRKAEVDTESGVGKGSFSPFSDLFRYKLLYEKGGYWVDMDVTCLRPFDFDTPYVFRAHRVGVVGNIMKCPPRSRLMKALYEKVAGKLNPHSEWLMTNRMLSEEVKRLRLTRYIRKDVWNEESWWDVIRHLVLGGQSIPGEWHAVHWINEFWRTLAESGGVYRGKRLFEVVPDKNEPKADSALAQLYAKYLPPALMAKSTAAAVKIDPPMPLNYPARRQPPSLPPAGARHMNVLIASLARGGAERIVLETLAGLAGRNITANLFVIYNANAAHGFNPPPNVKIHRLHTLDIQARLGMIAEAVAASPDQMLYTHLIRTEHLKVLWGRGIKTIPVIHNTHECWQDAPPAYNVPEVPMVVAVSEEVGRQMREKGCTRPVTVVRHELQRWFTVEEQRRNRLEIRDRYGIGEGTLLIGMVGEFKSQKAYTRAVRVLAEIRKQVPVKLMILGGWDHDWGHGRQTYIATHRLAMDLGVITDMFTPGPMPDPEKYYAAFDVFLNTSAYEGLSVAVMEAIQTGCPIVISDVGGNREVLPPEAVLVKDPSNINEYVEGIDKVLQPKPRPLAQRAVDHDLVPMLWHWLAKYGARAVMKPAVERSGVLFLTDNLNTGGAQRSLANLLGHWPRTVKSWVCVLEAVYAPGHLEEIERSGTPVYSAQDLGDYMERVERVMDMIERFRVRDVCFWNVDPRIKLLLAKIFPAGTVRLTDVSPGPYLLVEMGNAELFQRRIALSATQYWGRLEHFVAKHKEGVPKEFPNGDGKAVVIPNGVVKVPETGTMAALPKMGDPELVIGAVCRITPGKRIDFLIEMMAELNRSLTGASLVIVGGVDPRHAEYWRQVLGKLNARQVANIHFAGAQADVTPYMRRFKVLAMLCDTPGCPNASLEAMALGVPVVANAAGGIGEQVLHGINGFLVSGNDPKEMADYLRYLLVNRKARHRFSEAAKITAEKDFPMDRMAARYSKLFAPNGASAGVPARMSKAKPMRKITQKSL